MDVFAYKIIKDIAKILKTDHTINEFEVVNIPETDKNTCPILRVQNVLALESWTVRHILPYAIEMVLAKHLNDAEKMENCLLTVNLLHPDMSTAWSRRKELVRLGKLPARDEMRITRMALSVNPKCNEPMAHRRWLIENDFINDPMVFSEELNVMIWLAREYPCNYHAWSHRQWCLRRMMRSSPKRPNLPPASAIILQKNHIINVLQSTPLPMFLDDLESNLAFVSMHVSDHSGVHHRTFLLQEIFNMFHNANEEGPARQNVLSALSVYHSFKKKVMTNVNEFFKNYDKTIIDIYTTRIKNDGMTAFELIISFILEELKRNESLNQLYQFHESLWCYRRFLIHLFNFYLTENILILSDIATAYTQQLLHYEQAVINQCVDNKVDLVDIRVLQNYCNWLKRVAKLDVVMPISVPLG